MRERETGERETGEREEWAADFRRVVAGAFRHSLK